MNYDEISRRLSADYSLFLFAIQGQYLSILTPGAEATPVMLRGVNGRLRSLALSFSESASASIESFIERLTRNTSDSVVKGIQAQKAKLLEQIHGIMANDLAYVQTKLMHGSKGYGRLIGSAKGAMNLLIQKKAATLDFRAPDTSARKWNSSALLRSYVRDFAYQSTIECQVDALLQAGSVLGKVVYPSSDHPNQDMIISLSSEIDSHKTFASIRDLVFHPNSHAEVVHV